MAGEREISSAQLDAKLKEFETKLKRLYRTYEQYFIGVENRPPNGERRQLERLYREIDQLPMIKTTHKFRYRNLVQKYNSYKAYWNRVTRQIEQGTYHRDLARARARKKRRDEHEEQREEESSEVSGETSDDGAIEIDDTDLEDMDLGCLEEELAEMDNRGEFEKYVATAKVKREGFPEDERPERAEQGGEAEEARPTPRAADEAPSSDWQPPEPDENVKQQRLAELQEKLGLSGRGARSSDTSGQGQGQNPFERGNQEPTKKARPENPSAPSRGADMSKLRKLRRAKERIEREQSKKRDKGANKRARKHSGRNRVIRRDSSASGQNASSSRSSGGSSSGDFSEEKSRKIYNSLVEAKRRCNEDTSNLNYDSFKKSMDRQRTRIQKKKGARNVDFKVVIKDGSAFLKPETDD